MDRRKGTQKILPEAFGGPIKSAVFCFIILIVGACANYATRVASARGAIDYGQYDSAIDDLKRLVDRDDNDRLLYLLDLGLAYHAAGRYGEAIETFLKADQLAEIVDYTSLSQEIGSFVANDNLKQYRGENFEKVLINVYLAMDYSLAGQWDDALVECRRVNQKLDRMIREGGLPYERNGFAKYLSAVLFEARGEYNDAFVDYRQLLRWNAQTPFLGVGLLRMADKLKASQEFAEFKKQFGSTPYKVEKGEGEIILILEQGRGPIKVPYEGFYLIPRFQKRFYSSQHGVLRVGALESVSQPLFDIERTAIRELDHKIGLIAAKKVAGVVAKEVIANRVAKENEALGILTWLLLRGTDQADLRSWSTLPARLQIARLVVPAGRHEVVLDRVSSSGAKSVARRWPGIEVKAGELKFLAFRMTD